MRRDTDSRTECKICPSDTRTDCGFNRNNTRVANSTSSFGPTAGTGHVDCFRKVGFSPNVLHGDNPSETDGIRNFLGLMIYWTDVIRNFLGPGQKVSYQICSQGTPPRGGKCGRMTIEVQNEALLLEIK